MTVICGGRMNAELRRKGHRRTMGLQRKKGTADFSEFLFEHKEKMRVDFDKRMK